MKAAIFKSAQQQEFETPERCAILEASNDEDDTAASIARARVPVGITTTWHRLDGTAERYLITEGTGRVEVEGLSPTAVGPGDVVRIPPGAAQRITNTGTGDLLFYAICTPRFQPDCYHTLE